MTLSNLDETIAALGSAPGGAARGIIRISGEATQDILTKIFQPKNLASWNQAQQAGVHTGTISLPDSSPAIAAFCSNFILAHSEKFHRTAGC